METADENITNNWLRGVTGVPCSTVSIKQVCSGSGSPGWGAPLLTSYTTWAKY